MILGAGVVGLSVAEQLILAGSNVTIVESSRFGRESSWAGGGILAPLCPWDYSEEVTRLTGLGASMFPSWSEALLNSTGIDPEYESSGMLVLPPYDSSVALGWCKEHDWRAVEQADSLLLPLIAQVRNPRLVQALGKNVERLGGRIVEHCDVLGINVRSNKVSSISTACGEFSAENYIVTAGAWSKKILGEHALQLDIRPIRGQMLLFKFDSPPLKHILLQDGLYLIPRRDGHLLVGSTLEDVGFDKSTTVAARDMLRHRAETLLPALRGMPLIQQWSGLRPGSPHNIPTIGQHPRLKNLYINSGHFRYGVTMAPASARILINEITGAKQPFDVSPYRAGWGVDS